MRCLKNFNVYANDSMTWSPKLGMWSSELSSHLILHKQIDCRENKLLWQEMGHLRGAHMKQQQIVAKLVQFMVALIQPQHRLGKRHILAIDSPHAKVARLHDKLPASQQDVGEALDRLMYEYAGAGPTATFTEAAAQQALGNARFAMPTTSNTNVAAPLAYAPSSPLQPAHLPPAIAMLGAGAASSPSPSYVQPQPTPPPPPSGANLTVAASTPTPIVYSPAAAVPPPTSGGIGAASTGSTTSIRTTPAVDNNRQPSSQPHTSGLTAADMNTYLNGMDQSISNCRDMVRGVNTEVRLFLVATT